MADRTVSSDDLERQDAMRLLLRHPLVTSHGDHGEAFAVIRRHRDHLRQDFRQLLGYRLVVESNFARLYKAGLGPGKGRPLLRSSGVAFTPRAYAYLSLCCAVLLTGRQQMLLSTLVDDVRHAAAEAGVALGDDSVSDRRALTAALIQLVDWGVLVEDDGIVGAYADNAGAEALLYVERELVRHLLAVPLREVEHRDVLVANAADPGHAGPRHRARRMLVEEPAVLVDHVDDETWAWLRSSQRREADILHDAFGLELEIRAEGVAALDPRDELTDVAFPRGGARGHASLLALSELVQRLRPGNLPRDAIVGSVRVPSGLLAEVVAELFARHPSWHTQAYADRPDVLARDVEELLVDVGLLRRTPTGLDLASIASRYAPHVIDAAPTAAQLDLEDLP